jgi:uncharacterized protein
VPGFPPSNPFRFGDLALDDAFTNREQELRALRADALNGQNVVLFAPRRFGKSSLVWRVAARLVREGVLVAQVDLMRTPTKERLAEALARTIHDDIASRLFRARERLRVFAGLRITPTVTIDPADGAVAFSFTPGPHPSDTDATLERLLELPAQLAAERGRRVVLVFDEFQEVAEIDPGLPSLMRSVFQEQGDVAHLYLGSRRHMMERIFNDANEPFWRSAKHMELGPIPARPFAAFIGRQFERTGRTADRDAVQAALQITRGHPYGTQELCYAWWEETPPGERADAARLERALADVLRSENAHFSRIWEKAPRVQRLVLDALAAEPGRPLAADYRRRHGLPAPSSVQKALQLLEADELVGREPGHGFQIAEPFLAEWLRRVATP